MMKPPLPILMVSLGLFLSLAGGERLTPGIQEIAKGTRPAQSDSGVTYSLNRRFPSISKELILDRFKEFGCSDKFAFIRNVDGTDLISCRGAEGAQQVMFNLISRDENRAILFDNARRNFHARYTGLMRPETASILAGYHASLIMDSYLGPLTISEINADERKLLAAKQGSWFVNTQFVLRGVLRGSGTFILAMDDGPTDFSTGLYLPYNGKAISFDVRFPAQSCIVAYKREDLQELRSGDALLVMSSQNGCKWHVAKVIEPLQSDTMRIEPIELSRTAKASILRVEREPFGKYQPTLQPD